MTRFSQAVTWLRDYPTDAWCIVNHQRAFALCSAGLFELGVGNGLLAIRLASSFQTLIGLDHDPADPVIRKLKVSLVIATALSLPMRGNSVDVVYAPFGFITNFMTEDELTRLLSEMSRAIPNGRNRSMNGFDSQRVHNIYG